MTIDEAIKEQQDYLATGYLLGQPKLRDAIELGIEALKRLRHDRLVSQPKHILLLPGETEE